MVILSEVNICLCSNGCLTCCLFLARAINLTEKQQSQIGKYPAGTSPSDETSQRKSDVRKSRLRRDN